MLLWLALGMSAQSRAADIDPAIEAAILYNLALFTTWPETSFASAGSPINICLLQAEAVQGELERGLKERSIDSRPVRAVTVADPAEPPGCHLLYVGDPVPPGETRLAEMATRPVLTVHAGPAGIPGTVIRLYPAAGRMRFEVDMRSVREKDLGLSSKLLRMARVLNP